MRAILLLALAALSACSSNGCGTGCESEAMGGGNYPFARRYQPRPADMASGGGSVPIQVVIQADNTQFGSATRVLTLSPETANNYNFVDVEIVGGGSVVSVADNASGGSNTYVKDGEQVTIGKNEIWRAKLVNGGATTVTVTLDNSLDVAAIVVAEVPNIDLTTPVESGPATDTSGFGGADDIYAGSLTPASQVFIFATAFYASGNACTLDGGWTSLANVAFSTGAFRVLAAYRVSAAGTYRAHWSSNANTYASGVSMAYKAL